MGIYDEYRSRDELVAALESQITESVDAEGVATWRFHDVERDELTRRVESATQDAQRARRRGDELEARLEQADRRRAEAAAQLERLRAVEGDDDAVAALKRYAALASESQSRVAELEGQLAPLREENERFREREARREIESQLVDAARRLNCCESALRDVKRLAPSFRLNEDGLAVTEDARTAAEALRDEIALSPHWLNRSRGGDASPGTERTAYDSREMFLSALERGDFADAIRFAPREGTRR